VAVVVWADSAIHALGEIAAYIAQDRPRSASALVSRIFARVDRLEAFPSMGRVVSEFASRSLRELLVDNYRVVYRVEGDIVTVLAVQHGARRLTDLAEP